MKVKYKVIFLFKLINTKLKKHISLDKTLFTCWLFPVSFSLSARSVPHDKQVRLRISRKTGTIKLPWYGIINIRYNTRWTLSDILKTSLLLRLRCHFTVRCLIHFVYLLLLLIFSTTHSHPYSFPSSLPFSPSLAPSLLQSFPSLPSFPISPSLKPFRWGVLLCREMRWWLLESVRTGI